LGIGDWGLGPIPNPQSPIPNPQSPIIYNLFFSLKYFFINILKYNYIFKLKMFVGTDLKNQFLKNMKFDNVYIIIYIIIILLKI
jgi:hypothetical protein